MKTICILSYERTGSNWLGNIFSGDSTYSALELLSYDTLLFGWRMIYLLDKVYKADPAIINTFRNIYQPNNFLDDLDTDTVKKIKRSLHTKYPYDKNLIQAFKEAVYSQNHNFVFKLFPQHLLDNNINISYINDISDYIIFNYRNDILSSFISYNKALQTDKWCSCSLNKTYAKKINWDIYEYKKYYESIIKTIQILNNYYANVTKPKIILCYETIHRLQNNIEKINFIDKRLKMIDQNFIWRYNSNIIFNKENTIQNIQDNFNNENKFLKDLPNIKRYIHE